jgi:Endonuclease-reverse transcriptase
VVPILDTITGFHGQKIITGDFNLQHPSWDHKVGIDPNAAVAKQLFGIINKHQLEVLNPFILTWSFTHPDKLRTIDLFLVSADSAHEFPELVKEYSTSMSDHAILSSLFIKNKNINNPTNKNRKYEKEQKEEFKKTFQISPFIPNLTIENLQSWAETWIAQGQSTNQKLFSQMPQTYQPKGAHAEWWNSRCKISLTNYCANPSKENSDLFRQECRMAR